MEANSRANHHNTPKTTACTQFQSFTPILQLSALPGRGLTGACLLQKPLLLLTLSSHHTFTCLPWKRPHRSLPTKASLQKPLLILRSHPSHQPFACLLRLEEASPEPAGAQPGAAVTCTTWVAPSMLCAEPITSW